MNSAPEGSALNQSERITGDEDYNEAWKRRSNKDSESSIALDHDPRGADEKEQWRLSLRIKKHERDNEIESVRSSLTLIAKDTDSYRNFQVNTYFIIGLVATVCCAGFQLGHVVACTNQLNKYFEASYDEIFTKDGKGNSFYHSMIGSSGIFGCTIGAISAN